MRSIRMCSGVLFLIGYLAVGCVGKTVPMNFGPKQGVAHDPAVTREIEARSCGFNLAGVLPVSSQNLYENAYAKLEREAGFDYLAEIKGQPYWRYAVIGTMQCVRLVGKGHPRIN